MNLVKIKVRDLTVLEPKLKKKNQKTNPNEHVALITDWGAVLPQSQSYYLANWNYIDALVGGKNLQGDKNFLCRANTEEENI